MGRPARVPHALLPVFAVAVLGLSACGGDKKKDDPKATATASADETATPAPKPELQQLVKPLGDNAPAEPSGEATIESGQSVLLLTKIRNPDSIAGESITISFPANARKRLEIVADGPGTLRSTAEATIRSGKIALTKVSHTCVQPGETFCPVKLERKGTEYRAKITVREGKTPFIVTAETVRPGKLKPPVALPRGGASPEVQQLLRVAAPTPSEELVSEVSVGDGAKVLVVPEITNLSNAAGSRFGVVIPRKSGAALEVGGGTGSFPSSSTATIRGSDGPIKVSEFQYNCAPSPYGFCPMKVKTTAKSYILRGRVPTGGVPIVIALTISDG